MPVILILERWWKLGAGIILGALLCFPLAKCHGERVAYARQSAEIDAANARAELAESNARITADRLYMERETARQETLKELSDVVEKAPVGTATSALLERLRANDKNRKAKATR